MNSYQKNVFVGLTVTLAGMILVWMIFRFGGAPAQLFTEKRMTVNFVADRADGLGEGSMITFRGVTVGAVSKVRRSADSMQVLIDAELDQNPPLPSNVRASIVTTGLLGGNASLVLELLDPKPSGEIKSGQTIEAKFTGLGLLPPEFSELAKNLSSLSAQIRESNIVGNINQTVDAFREEIQKIGTLVDSTQSLLGDEKVQADLKASVARLKDVIEKSDRVAGNLETFSGSLAKISEETQSTLATARETIGKADTNIEKLSADVTERLQQVAKILERFQSITAKVDDGEGSAGMLLNDPKLYQAMVDSTMELNLTIKDLRRLVEQWEQEGVTLKLK